MASGSGERDPTRLAEFEIHPAERVQHGREAGSTDGHLDCTAAAS